MDEREIATLEIETAGEIATLESAGENEIAVLEESAGAVSLAPLFNGAAAEDILAGKRVYADDGSIIEGQIKTYAGIYTVTPMITSQKLETAEKYMKDDVRIHTIPTTETANSAGGYTFKIG